MDKPGNVYVAVVDDDENLCRSLARLLRAAGMQPITYLSAEAFLADTKHPQFDCLLLDVQLTGMSGLELQRQLVATGPLRYPWNVFAYLAVVALIVFVVC